MMKRAWLTAIGVISLSSSLVFGQTTGGVRVPTGGVHVPYPRTGPPPANVGPVSPGYGYPGNVPNWPGYGNGYIPPTYINYNPPIYVGYNGYGLSAYSPPLIVSSGYGPFGYGFGGYAPNYSPVYAPTTTNNIFVQPPVGQNQTARGPVKPSAKNIAKAKDYIERGDRFYQTNKNAQAKERYQLAVKADPTNSDAIARLATMALVKGDRNEALGLMAAAIAANEGWLANPGNIQTMFGEPAEFHKLLGNLEADVQANPDDRAGWMLLGMELYLSGRADRAKDVFQRLNDRKPDPMLAAFLDAVKIEPSKTTK